MTRLVSPSRPDFVAQMAVAQMTVHLMKSFYNYPCLAHSVMSSRASLPFEFASPQTAYSSSTVLVNYQNINN